MSHQHARSDETAAGPPATDSAARFASDLRDLRRAAGDPTLVALGRRAGVSKSVLSDAFRGRALPTERTVERLIRVLGADVDAWLARRGRLDPGARITAPLGPARATAVSRRAAAALAAGSAILSSVVSLGAAWWLWAPGHAGAPGPLYEVQTGVDPADTPCVDDATVVASETRERDTQLQIVYSDACRAAWARVTRYDNASAGNTVSASIYRQIAPEAADRQDTTEPDAQSAYTTLIVRDDARTRLCADGAISVDGVRLELGAPVCV
ncbi:DUF2690 domain-containing protein [Cellulomonas sp. B6]|uniref:helix-turn-helix domain-containing protein n=1 Tax=Cellulomonas sp. B6 TaxID=1295626 RepID=UPI00073B214E|nr:DUF2690 domain-containing protein [Cellulomonas sp. B6]KSW29865.1 hypothetical protein ATM99_06030 [Cellulomonas sp. B6]